jgi:mortality factor 4-like protein 1
LYRVGAERLVAATEDNLTKMNLLNEQSVDIAKNSKKNKQKGVDIVSEGVKKRKILADDSTVQHIVADEETLDKINIKLPGLLKKQLIIDWENITRNQLLVPLPKPSNISVQAILLKFNNMKIITENNNNNNINYYEEISKGLLRYFDGCLGLTLLYRFERPQYNEFIANKSSSNHIVLPSSIYGAEHLLRFFVRLPALLKTTALNSADEKLFTQYCNSLLNFLLAKQAEFFAKKYIPTDKQYIANLNNNT